MKTEVTVPQRQQTEEAGRVREQQKQSRVGTVRKWELKEELPLPLPPLWANVIFKQTSQEKPEIHSNHTISLALIRATNTTCESLPTEAGGARQSVFWLCLLLRITNTHTHAHTHMGLCSLRCTGIHRSLWAYHDFLGVTERREVTFRGRFSMLNIFNMHPLSHLSTSHPASLYCEIPRHAALVS